MGSKRKNIPKSVRLEVLHESGYMCANPICRQILTREIHHIEWVKDGGDNDASNLLPLCPNCHSLVTKGEIPEESVRQWKGLAIALNDAFGRKGIDLLLFLHSQRDSGVPMVFSGDGVLQFAQLITANLVKIGSSSYTRGAPGLTAASSHQLALTSRGEHLVEAWSASDQRAFEHIVGEIDL